MDELEGCLAPNQGMTQQLVEQPLPIPCGGSHQVLDGLEMRGNESVLCVRCEKGFWLSGLGKCMKAGGKAFGVDQWDAEDCQYDGQWVCMTC